MPLLVRHATRPARRVVPGRRAASWALVFAMVASIVTVLSVSPAAAAPSCHPYPDVSSANQHCGNIAWLKGQAITKPADGFYRPGNVVTRGSMTAFLFRLTNPGVAQPVCRRVPFPDMTRNTRFCGYISWAKENNIAYGYPDGTYHPDRPVTRGAMAAYLFRIAHPGKGASQCVTRPFVDVAFDDTFCGVITWMVDHGITYGVGNGYRYGTTQSVTRQQMASFLHRVDDLIVHGGGGSGSDPAGNPGGDPLGPGAIPAGNTSQSYLDAISGLTSFNAKVRAAVDYLPYDGRELTDLYSGTIDNDPGIAGITWFPSCKVGISQYIPDSIILDVLRHEYIHVLQCRTYGSAAQQHYGGYSHVERIADIGAYLVGANYLYYLHYDPFGLGEVHESEIAEALDLLQRYHIPIRQQTRLNINDTNPLSPSDSASLQRATIWDSGTIVTADTPAVDSHLHGRVIFSDTDPGSEPDLARSGLVAVLG